MAPAPIQRWALMLTAYHYKICYKSGNDHANANGLSWLPMSHHITEVPILNDVLLLFQTLTTLGSYHQFFLAEVSASTSLALPT